MHMQSALTEEHKSSEKVKIKSKVETTNRKEKIKQKKGGKNKNEAYNLQQLLASRKQSALQTPF